MTGRSLVVAVALVGLYVGCGGTTATDAFGPTADGGTGADGSNSGTDGGAGTDGAAPVNTTCAAPGECVLGAPGCCGVGCGTPALSAYVAIHRGEQSALLASTCDSTQPIGCPDCATVEQPAFQAFCRQNKCVAIDVRRDEISRCNSDDDCSLRPAQCCPCGPVPASSLVAIAKVASDAYRRQVCDPAVACPKCPWEIPSTARARCDGSRNHCVVDPN